jgi:hypothetical protein
MISRGNAAAAVLAAAFLAGCGSSSNPENGKHGERADGFGDPFVTDAQVRAVRVGESEAAAFKQLGGRSDSGYNGQQAGPRKSYDYPIRGTGSTDVTVEESQAALWWEVCIEDGRVIGKERGKEGALTMNCRRGGAPPTEEERGF